MELNVCFRSACSACFELKNDLPYDCGREYTVYLNGEPRFRSRRNVFSLFGLAPDTAYRVEARFEDLVCSAELRTEEESCAVSVRAFGAVGDGSTDDTRAIQTAIHFLPENGRLFFPAGTYRCAPLALRSGITLELRENAVLLGSPDRRDYPVIPGTVSGEAGETVHFGAFEGQARPMYQALLTGEYARHVRIIGPGTVDGNAQNSEFWTAFREDPVARPRLCFLNRCEDVVFHGISAANSPSWNFHPYFSEKLGFYDVSVSAPDNSPNTDALDPESCDRVEIVGCRFSVGDDCIAIKSGKIELGREFKRPASRHVIRNCLMERGHGAVVLGSETGGGVKELSVSQCLFRDTDRGLRIKTRRGRGENCRITDVLFENIRMDGVLTPIVINAWYNCCDPDRFSEYVWSREALPADERTPRLGSFTFRDMRCENAQVAACYIDGLPEMPIEAVTLDHVSVSFAENARPGKPSMRNFAEEVCRLGLYFENVKTVTLRNVSVSGQAGDSVVARGTGCVTVIPSPED